MLVIYVVLSRKLTWQSIHLEYFDCILKDFALVRNVPLISYPLFFHVFIDEIQLSRRLFKINKANLSIFPSSRTRQARQKTVDSSILQFFTDKFIFPVPAMTSTSTSHPDPFLPAMTFKTRCSRKNISGNTYLLKFSCTLFKSSVYGAYINPKTYMTFSAL